MRKIFILSVFFLFSTPFIFAQNSVKSIDYVLSTYMLPALRNDASSLGFHVTNGIDFQFLHFPKNTGFYWGGGASLGLGIFSLSDLSLAVRIPAGYLIESDTTQHAFFLGGALEYTFIRVAEYKETSHHVGFLVDGGYQKI